MRKFIFISPIIVFLCIIFIFLYLLIIKNDPSELPSVLINQKAPKFETLSLLSEKNFLYEKEFNNDLKIVNFFASWCVPCSAEHKYIDQLSKEKGIKVIGINYKDDPKKALQWLNNLGNPYSDIAIDSNGDIAINWGVYGIPETFIVNYNNIIQYRLAGPITKKNYAAFYQQIIKNK